MSIYYLTIIYYLIKNKIVNIYIYILLNDKIVKIVHIYYIKKNLNIL
jgi:hypothetical protein